MHGVEICDGLHPTFTRHVRTEVVIAYGNSFRWVCGNFRAWTGSASGQVELNNIRLQGVVNPGKLFQHHEIQIYMQTIRISPDEKTIYEDFKEGNSVQVRVTVGAAGPEEFAKGRTVRVVHGDFEGEGRIVSEPLVIGHPLEGEEQTISLIVEKV